ncbi:phosphopantetheine-binding protein [Streptomyces cinereospinus]|uniref:Phosphopantetheine-binding protein n=1 Tax=Streptomyces cinereospinus TaxID=285561 RepID=A0ABV5MXD3_9ACTN
MEPDEIRRKVRDIISTMSPARTPVRTPADRLVDDLGYDSLTFIELSVALEEEFVMDDIEEERTAGLRTVADVEDLIVGLHKPAA